MGSYWKCLAVAIASAALVSAASPALAAPPIGSKGCDTPAGNRVAGEVTHNTWPISQARRLDGSAIRRTYTAHVPPQHRGDTPLPIVFDLHIAFSSGFQQNLASEMSAKGAAEGFIVVQPDAWPWWAGSLMEEALRGGASDVEYVRLLLDTFDRNLCFDRNRIFVVGGNFIGFMGQALACASAKGELGGHRIAAVAAVSSFPIPTREEPPWVDSGLFANWKICPALSGDPIPLLVVISNNDLRLGTLLASALDDSTATALADQPIAELEMMRTAIARLPISRKVSSDEGAYRVFDKAARSPGPIVSVLAVFTSGFWVTDNGCSNAAMTDPPPPPDGWGVAGKPISFTCDNALNPRQEVQLIFFGTGSPDRNGHIWPGKPAGTLFSATEAVWTFFSEHPR